jgi:hypothetical protein
VKLRWKLLIGVLVIGIGLLVWTIVTVTPFLTAMKERGEVQDRVFMPFEELRADFLHNGFGVFILEFHDHSLLSDENVERLLLLNDMPPKYELTVMLETQNITDESIETLGKLKSVDSLFVDKSGMTDEGVARLELLLPENTIAHYTWEKDRGEQ